MGGLNKYKRDSQYIDSSQTAFICLVLILLTISFEKIFG
jgi:hypothetical protein